MKRCKHYTLDCGQEERTCEGCAYCEKSADEIFEELGFEKDEPYKNIISYEDDKRLIEFWTDRQVVTCDGDITKDIIKAINKKMEEQGWE